MACRKHSPGDPCCTECTPPTLPDGIAFNDIGKLATDWIDTDGCCPSVVWDLAYGAGYGSFGLLLSESIYRNDAACDQIPTPAYYCVRSYLYQMTFYLSKFACDSDWWVAMKADILVRMGASTSPTVCPSGALVFGTVSLYREKFVSSVAAPTTITFTASDHYDWTASGACHEYNNCPPVYTGEISTDIAFCCGTILNPNCVDLNVFTLDWTTNDFSFDIT